MNGGFVPLRRGILEHAERGKLPPIQFAAYVQLILSADSKTGVVWASAKLLAVRFGFEERAARRALEELESKGYIKRFPEPGSHRNYPILINKFFVTQGARKGLVLNAAKSADWREPVFESGEDVVKEVVKEQPSTQEGEVKKEKTSSAIPPRAEPLTAGPSTFQLTPPAPNGFPKEEIGQIAVRLHEYFCAVQERKPTRYKLTATRRAMLTKQLKELWETVRSDKPELSKGEALVEVERLGKYAIERHAESDWHMGRHPKTAGRKYDGLEYTFGNYERLEKWVNT